jgi:hypothetical protein
VVNLGALRDRARSLSGIRLQSLRSDDEIDDVLNESYQEIIGLSAWPFLRASETSSVAAGQDSFETPSGFSEVISVTYQDDLGNTERLRQTTIDEIDRLDADAEGEPSFYARLNDRAFQLWPVPEKPLVFSIRGKSTAPALRNDSDQPLFDEQFHVIVSYRTASKILAEEGDDSGRSELYQNEASLIFARMQQFYNRSSDVGMFVMGGRRRRHVHGY